MNGSHPGFAAPSSDTRQLLVDNLAQADEFARRLARQRPLLAAGLALTAGFVIGRLVARHG